MRAAKISIRGLLVAVAFAATACASLTYPSTTWLLLLQSLVCVSLLIALLGIIYRREERRAFWIGFLLFGLSSWAFATWQFSSVVGSVALIQSDREQQLATEIAALQADLSRIEQTVVEPRKSAVYQQRETRLQAAQARLAMAVGAQTRTQILQPLLVLMMAFLGSRISLHFFASREPRQA